MGADAQPTKQYQVTASVDLQSLFSALDIEHLTVSDRRLLVIYAHSILNIDVKQGDLQRVDVLEVAVLDHDPNGGIDSSLVLLETLIEQISETADVGLSEVR